MTFKAVYKCRLCGKEFTEPNRYSKDEAKICSFLGKRCVQNKGGCLPYEYHICDSGDVGFGDLLGARKVLENESDNK